MRLDLFVKLKYQSNTKNFIKYWNQIGIKYSVRNLLFDVNNNAWPAN